MMSHGYFGIGIYDPKTAKNVGCLWRSAYLFGAAFMFMVGERYKRQRSDTVYAQRHIPLWEFDSLEVFESGVPKDGRIICVELTDKARDLNSSIHPKRGVYILGSEDHGLPVEFMRGKQTIKIPTIQPVSMNVAVAGSIVLYDRFIKGGRYE